MEVLATYHYRGKGMSAYEFTHRGTARTITVGVDNQDACCETLAEEFRGFLLAVGFHPDTVREYFVDDSTLPPTAPEKQA